jgi:ABC-2 type transport system permease protein
MLISLPVKVKTIFFSKLFHLLVVNYLPFALIYFPAVITYAIFVPTSFLFWLLVLPVFLLTPLAAVTVAIMVSYLIGLFIVRLKYKTLISVVLSVALIVFIFLVSARSSIIDENPGEFTRVINNFLSWFKIENLAFAALRDDLLNFLLLALVSLIPFSLLAFVLGKNYQRINSRNYFSFTNKNFKLTAQKKTSQNKALVKREIKRYFSSPAYIMNTSVGPIMSTMLLVIIKLSINDLSLEFGDIQDISRYLPFMIVSLSVFSLGLTSTTAASISLEGNKFWILKSSPITPKQVFSAKIFINMMITVPFIIINTILAQFLFEPTFIDTIFLIIVPTLFSLMMSYVGLYANILLPRFNYDSEVKAIKQSMSVLVTMTIGFISLAVVIVPAMFINFGSGKTLLAYFVEAVSATTLLLLFVVLLNKHGTKRYNNLIA